MTHGLNLVIPLKQDAETKAKLAQLDQSFATQIQGEIEDALADSKMVHFARVFAIEDKYILVITEYEGSHEEYIEFFRVKLPNVFRKIFDLAALDVDVGNPAAFAKAAIGCNIRSLGLATDPSKDFNGNPAGWLFSAYKHKTVRDIQAALGTDS